MKISIYKIFKIKSGPTIELKKNESEFKKCQLTPEYLNSFQAPYVKESYVKVGLNLEDIHLISF